ncbi:hypothetical protein JXX18_22165, partial [Ruthenibacterium lactatiformans]|uniref:hypothetical protein n=1 Tax=Ruthenibacterium lactatiformans TaxID=1550024 RepID=UPI0019672EB8
WSALPGSRKAGASGILCSAPFLKNEKTAGRAREKKPSGFPEGSVFSTKIPMSIQCFTSGNAEKMKKQRGVQTKK